MLFRSDATPPPPAGTTRLGGDCVSCTFEAVENQAETELVFLAVVVAGPQHVLDGELALADGAGRRAGRQRFSDSLLPEQLHEVIRAKVDMEDAYLSQGVGEVEAMSAAGTAEHDLVPY